MGRPPITRSDADYYRLGDRLIARKGTTLPANCIVTGSQGAGQLTTKKFVWGPPWVWAVIVLVSPLIGVIIYVFMRKSGVLTYFISDEAAAQRRKGLIVGLTTTVGGIALFAGAVRFDAAALIIVGLATLIAGVFIASLVGRPYQLMKIDKEWIHLTLKREFWDAVPNIPQQPHFLPPSG